METLIVILLVLCLIALTGVIAGIFMAFRKLAELKEVQQRDDIKKDVNESLRGMADQLAKANQSIGALHTINQKVDNINNLFFSQKLRGNFGERVLQDLLETNFPKSHFSLQHRFKDGQIVDAVLKSKDGLIAIDSKFPADNYRKMVAPGKTPAEIEFEKNEFAKAVRKHISDIEKKYILPGEGTAEFAIMYVPSEAIFYEILSEDNGLTAFAGDKHILMTSPNTMSYYLHIMRLGQERTRIEENAQKVWGLLSGLQQDFAKFGETLRVAWGHVTNAKKSIDSVGNDFSQLSGKIEQIKELK